MEDTGYENVKSYFIVKWAENADKNDLNNVIMDPDIKNIINSPRQLEQITSIEKLLQILGHRNEASIQTLYRIVSAAIQPHSPCSWLITIKEQLNVLINKNPAGCFSSFSKPYKVQYGVNYTRLENFACAQLQTPTSTESQRSLRPYESEQSNYIDHLDIVYQTIGSNWCDFIRLLPEMKECDINNILKKYQHESERLEACLRLWANNIPNKQCIKQLLHETAVRYNDIHLIEKLNLKQIN